MPSRIRACVNRQLPGRSGRRVTSPLASAADSTRVTSWLVSQTSAARVAPKSVPSTLAAASKPRALSSRSRSSDETRRPTSALPPAIWATASASGAMPGWVASTRASVATYSGLPSERACTARARPGSTVSAGCVQDIGHRSLAQRRQPEHVQAGQPGQVPQRGPPRITSGVPAGNQHEQARPGQLGRELAEQEQRRMIGPLHIFQHNEQVGGTRCGGHSVGRRSCRTEPGRSQVVRAGAVGCPAADQPGAFVNAADSAQYPPPWPQRRRALLLHGTPPQNPLPATARSVSQLLR